MFVSNILWATFHEKFIAKLRTGKEILAVFWTSQYFFDTLYTKLLTTYH